MSKTNTAAFQVEGKDTAPRSHAPGIWLLTKSDRKLQEDVFSKILKQEETHIKKIKAEYSILKEQFADPKACTILLPSASNYIFKRSQPLREES